ncbi:cerberus [Anolis sagrei]|uniref:cerberus n=1 Tax=Anolis sagrei TaxID=38937 RepID=UPI00295BC248|nr:cerberus [Anolis sagrei ordinatus]
MYVLLLQILLISWLGTTEQTDEMQKKRRRRSPHLLPPDTLAKYLLDYEGTLEEPSLFVTHFLAEMERKKEDGLQIPKSILPYIGSHATPDLGSWAPPSPFPHPQNPPSHPPKRKSESLFRKDAKKFWDIFMLKAKSRSEEAVLPIKTNEKYQDICSTLPFSQTIAHENCENLVIQNNLCFGKCSSFHVPGLEDRLYTFCSHCLPTKFSMKRLEMNCTRAVPIVKVAMIVEECRCEVQRTTNPEMGFRHSDLLASIHGHN